MSVFLLPTAELTNSFKIAFKVKSVTGMEALECVAYIANSGTGVMQICCSCHCPVKAMWWRNTYMEMSDVSTSPTGI